MQDGINMQGGNFSEINKCAGWNKAVAGWKFFKKITNCEKSSFQ